jgi:hypothetical protein
MKNQAYLTLLGALLAKQVSAQIDLDLSDNGM